MANRYSTTKMVQGAGELADVLGKLGIEVQSTVVEAGVSAAVLPIKAAQQAGCPIRPDLPKSRRKLRPGEMRASITAKVVTYRNNGKAVGLVGPSGRAGRVAHLVEGGHLVTSSQKGKTIKKGTAKAASTGRTHVPPNPFIRRSVLNTLPAQAAAFQAAAGAAYLNAARST